MIFESKKQKVKVKKKIEKLKAKNKSFIYITFYLLFTTALHGQLRNFISSLISQVLQRFLGKNEKWKVLSEKRKKF